MAKKKKAKPNKKQDSSPVAKCTKEVQKILNKYECEISSAIQKVHLGRGMWGDSITVQIIEKQEEEPKIKTK